MLGSLCIASSSVVGAELAIAVAPKRSRHTAGRGHRVVALAIVPRRTGGRLKAVVRSGAHRRSLLDEQHEPR